MRGAESMKSESTPRTLTGHIVLPDRLLAGRVTFDDHILAVSPETDTPTQYILPGFIDTHVHGGDDADTMDGVAAIERLARFHARHGTTTILPTTITAPWPDVLSALQAIAEVVSAGVHDGPAVHGAHLEGPFISPHKRGAQPPFTQTPSAERVQAALATGSVRVVTLAPEIEDAASAIDLFAAAGVRISLGHTAADLEGTKNAIGRICTANGVPGGTHLFNAMAPVTGRSPGPVAALMCSPVSYAEIILDNHHVHPANFRLAHHMMPGRLILITDAMRATGLPDGPSSLGGQPVITQNGVARLEDGTLAGSLLTLDVALRNALNAGISLPEAARLVSTNAARYLGLNDRGLITPGLRADFAVLDHRFRISEVWVGGQRIA